MNEEREVFCGDCGAASKPGSAFCASCGTPIAGDSTPEQGANPKSNPGEPPPTIAAQGAAPKELADFQIEEEISRGGMGIVYRATDRRLDREVAIKVIAPELANDETFRKRFISESRSIASLDNPHILPIYQTGEGEGTLFLVTKLITGGDLSGALARKGSFTVPEVAAVVSQVGDALDAAHAKGLIHRDVKPANVLLDSGTGDEVGYLLSDFGVATTAGEESGLTTAGEVLGTVDYMAPEQIEGRKIDKRVDIYALGCVAIELLTGNAPFRRDSKQATLMAHLHEDPKIPADVKGADPEDLAAVFGLALAKDPEQRFESCGAFARALEATTTGSAIPVPTTATQKVVSPPQAASGSGRGIAIMAVGLLVVAAAALGAVLFTGGGSDGEDPQSGSVTATVPDPEPEPAPEPEPEPEPVEVTVEVEKDAKKDRLEVAENNNYVDIEYYTAAEWADFGATGQYPNIGGTTFRNAIVVIDSWGEYETSSFNDVILPLTDSFTEFTAQAGVDNSQSSKSRLTLEFLATDPNGEEVSVWGPRNLTPGAQPVPVSVPIDGYSRLIIRLSAPPGSDSDYGGDYDKALILGDPILTGTPSVSGS